MCSGEYGDHHDKMVAAIDNGRCTYSKKQKKSNDSALVPCTLEFDEITELDDNVVYYLPSWIDQFKILIFRMWLQMWRDRVKYDTYYAYICTYNVFFRVIYYCELYCIYS